MLSIQKAVFLQILEKIKQNANNTYIQYLHSIKVYTINRLTIRL